MADVTPEARPHQHGGQDCDPSEEAATAAWAPLIEAVDRVLAYGAAPPEYPGLALVPQPDIEALRAARKRMEELG